ncbi:hypothetical protein ACFVX4_11625, partial [Streptomyces sp. NPDC058240]
MSPLITALLHKDPAARPNAARVREALRAVAHPQSSIPPQTGGRPPGRSVVGPAVTTPDAAGPRPWYRTVRGRVITAVTAAAVLAGLVLAVSIPATDTPAGLPSRWETVDAKTVRLRGCRGEGKRAALWVRAPVWQSTPATSHPIPP